MACCAGRPGSWSERRGYPAPWRAVAGFARDAQIDEPCAELRRSLSGRRDPTRTIGSASRCGRSEKAAQELERVERLRPRDYDGLEGWLGNLAGDRHRSGLAGLARVI